MKVSNMSTLVSIYKPYYTYDGEHHSATVGWASVCPVTPAEAIAFAEAILEAADAALSLNAQLDLDYQLQVEAGLIKEEV